MNLLKRQASKQEWNEGIYKNYYNHQHVGGKTERSNILPEINVIQTCQQEIARNV